MAGEEHLNNERMGSAKLTRADHRNLPVALKLETVLISV